MRLSKTLRQVLGAALGAAIAGVISITLALPAVERHERMFDPPAPEQIAP
ncbi:MAG: hypothetical protein WEA77_10725 [Hyphomonas sp.]